MGAAADGRLDVNDLERIDAALIALRHLWTAPPRIEDPALGSVEMSTIWVVDTLRREPELSVAEIAERMGVAHSTASRLIARAQDAGAVTRTPDATDHRRVGVESTRQGRRLAEAALSYRLEMLSEATADWMPSERATFASLLTRFAHRDEPS